MNLTIGKLYFFNLIKYSDFKIFYRWIFQGGFCTPSDTKSAACLLISAEFIEIRHDEEMSDYFERHGYLKAWNHFRRRYPVSWSKVDQLLMMVARMMTKQRNRLFL